MLKKKYQKKKNLFTIALHSDHSHSSGLSESEFYSQLLTYGPAFFNNL